MSTIFLCIFVQKCVVFLQHFWAHACYVITLQHKTTQKKIPNKINDLQRTLRKPLKSLETFWLTSHLMMLLYSYS